MRDKILAKAKADIPLYAKDFDKYWEEVLKNISDEDLTDTYIGTLLFKNYKISLHNIDIKDFDQILDELFEDINSSFFLAIKGLYRSAHMHLRSSIELTLQLIYFLHHPIEYERWKGGDFYIKHEDLQNYIRSHPSISIDIEGLMDNIRKYWKKFSKHIHGESPIFFQCEKDVRKTNSFSVRDYNVWKSNFLKTIYSLNFLLLIFFISEINLFPSISRELLLSILSPDDRNLIES